MKSNKPISAKERAVVERFKNEICLHAAEIDKDEEVDWYGMSIGFFLACGLSINASARLALYVRYDKGYWQE